MAPHAQLQIHQPGSAASPLPRVFSPVQEPRQTSTTHVDSTVPQMLLANNNLWVCNGCPVSYTHPKSTVNLNN